MLATKSKVRDVTSSMKDDLLVETKRLMNLYVNEQIKNKEVSFEFRLL